MLAVEEMMKGRVGGAFMLIHARLREKLPAAFVAEEFTTRAFLVVNLPMTTETGGGAESLSTLVALKFGSVGGNRGRCRGNRCCGNRCC